MQSFSLYFCFFLLVRSFVSLVHLLCIFSFADTSFVFAFPLSLLLCILLSRKSQGLLFSILKARDWIVFIWPFSEDAFERRFIKLRGNQSQPLSKFDFQLTQLRLVKGALFFFFLISSFFRFCTRLCREVFPPLINPFASFFINFLNIFRL